VDELPVHQLAKCPQIFHFHLKQFSSDSLIATTVVECLETIDLDPFITLGCDGTHRHLYKILRHGADSLYYDIKCNRKSEFPYRRGQRPDTNELKDWIQIDFFA
jgi:hypothetical protein